MKKALLFPVFFTFFIYGCTDNGLLLRSNGKSYVSNDKNGIYKIGEPYQVSNIWYRPEENYNYKEVGIASWYGPDFHQGITANGETYNMYDLSAAHRTLPLPSIVKVTNLDNGKSVVVRVNDRGPFVNNRIIDLSKAAAEQLDFIDTGTAKVRVEILEDESKALKKAILDNGGKIVGGLPIPPENVTSSSDEALVLVPQETTLETEEALGETVIDNLSENETLYAPNKKREAISKAKVATTSVPNGFYIQAGAFSQKVNAILLQQRLNEFGPILIQDLEKNGGKLHRVRIGPFKTAQEAHDVMTEIIEQNGYKDMRLVQEK